jgi:hypothetical protein
MGGLHSGCLFVCFWRCGLARVLGAGYHEDVDCAVFFFGC